MSEGTVAGSEGPDAEVAAPAMGVSADAARLRQRAVFLRELAQARAMLARTTPWRTRSARVRAQIRNGTNYP